MNKMGTTIKNPLRRDGKTGFTKCCYCGVSYTSLGVSRHWNHCEDNPAVKARKAEHKRIKNMMLSPIPPWEK